MSHITKSFGFLLAVASKISLYAPKFQDLSVPLGQMGILKPGLSLEGGNLWRSLARGSGEFRLNVDLLHAFHALVELHVHGIKFLQQHAMANHVQRLQLATLDHLEELLPVHVNGCLTVAF